MKWHRDFGKQLLAVSFVLFIGGVGFRTYIDSLKTEETDEIWMKSSWIELNGTVARKLNIRGLYSGLGFYIADGKYVVSEAQKTTTDYEFEQVKSLKEYLDEEGIQLLYVNAPTKYVEDSFFEDKFGIRSYSNQNVDVFLDRLTEAGIQNLDLRKEIPEGLDIKEMFYRTDHHWTTESGLWAAEKISETLNEKFDYQIDMNLFRKSNYTFLEYNSCWLGEQGRKIGSAYLGLDDFTVIKPRYNTDITLTDDSGVHQGNFDLMLDETRYVKETEDAYADKSWYYSYLPEGLNTVMIKNNLQDQGKVLVLADSYFQVAFPFLSLGVAEADKLVLRNYEGSLREFIEDNRGMMQS